MNLERNLFIARQFEGGSIRPVSCLRLKRSDDAISYEFFYIKGATLVENFEPFLSFPDLERTYRSDSLFPFFRNRVMNRTRPEYPDFVSSLNLTLDAEPFEVLSRSGGHRATDQIEVFPEPERDLTTGVAQCRFFARGMFHIPGAMELAGELEPGITLELQPEPSNPVDPSAIVVATNGRNLGYVPRYMTSYVTNAIEHCPAETVRTVVEHVGPADNRHTRLMLRFECCWFDPDWPFASEIFEPLPAELRPVQKLRS